MKIITRSVTGHTVRSAQSAGVPVTLVTMPTFMTRLLGLLLLTLALSVSSCQAVFPDGVTINTPQQFDPGFGSNGR